MAETRALEFREGTSDKFWTITMDGTSFTVRFGRKGTAGQEQIKRFESAEAARAAFEKLVAEKLKKGYHDAVAVPEPAPAVIAEPPAGVSELVQALLAVDSYLKKNDPDSYRGFRRGASATELETLSRGVFGGAPLPLELAEWFLWHNGQKDDLQLLPDRVFRLMTASAAAKIAKEYRECTEDWAERWDKSWLPLMDNGAGDYLCYSTTTGKLFAYWHDADEDEEAEEDFASLKALAEAAIAMREEANPGPERIRIGWDVSRATPLTEINYQMVFRAPVGTTYYGGPVDGKYLVAINGPQQWIVRWAQRSLNQAFEMARTDAEKNDIKLALGTNGALWQVEKIVAAGNAWTVMASINGKTAQSATIPQ